MRTPGPFCRSFIACAALAALCSAQETPTALFDGREVKTNSRLTTHTFSPFNRYYSLIDPRRSLLLYDCAAKPTWCNDAEFSFQTIFSQAAAIAGPLNPNQTAADWYRQVTQLSPLGAADDLKPWQGGGLDGNPFQLLAIVNRMDLAAWDGRQWTGAEMRFVYGPKPTGALVPQLTVIFEFVLSGMSKEDFRDWAQAWLSLSHTAGIGDLRARLKKVFKISVAHPPLFARLRLNREVAGGPWQLAEWDFGRTRSPCGAAEPAKWIASHSMSRVPLQDQVLVAATHLGTPEYVEYARLWAADKSADPSGMPIAPCLLEEEKEYRDPTSLSMSTLIGVCAGDAAKRRILSLQQCSYCHSSETGTHFVHISNRKPNESSQLSGFLTGGGAGVRRQNNIETVSTLGGHFAVAVDYVNYTNPPACTTQTAKQHDVRSFNDLARRAAFLAAVLMADTNSPAYSTWVQEKINPFRTNFTD